MGGKEDSCWLSSARMEQAESPLALPPQAGTSRRGRSVPRLQQTTLATVRATSTAPSEELERAKAHAAGTTPRRVPLARRNRDGPQRKPPARAPATKPGGPPGRDVCHQHDALGRCDIGWTRPKGLPPGLRLTPASSTASPISQEPGGTQLKAWAASLMPPAPHCSLLLTASSELNAVRLRTSARESIARFSNK